MKRVVILLAMAVFLILCNNAFAYTINIFGPDEYLGGSEADLAAMRSNLGISGSVIEDFADYDNLVPGLTVSGPGWGGDNTWANSWGAEHTGSFIVWPTTENPATINIAQGAEMLGLGFGYLEYNELNWITELLINEEISIALTPTMLPDFNFDTLLRNGYLTIEPDEGDPLIESLMFGPLRATA